jgi:translation initiation factor SUI1
MIEDGLYGFNFNDIKTELDESFQKINIKVESRNARKSITTIHGIPSTEDHKELLKYFKKTFNCNGSMDEKFVIQLSGNQANKVNKYFVDKFPNIKVIIINQ